MSAAAAPWSVKGIDPKAREIAKDLARRSGMTLGEWLNSMIMDEPDEDDQVATLPRRSAIPDPYDRRARSRRLDDAYAGPSLDVLAERLEASERRSAEAIRSIEDAVSGLVCRLDRQEGEQTNLERRFDRVGDDIRDGHQRLKKLEQIDRAGGDDAHLAAVAERLDQAQHQTQSALKALERSFATLDNRLLQAETKLGPDEVREASRFERLAETLSRQVEGNRIEMMRRLDVVEIESRADRLERAINTVVEQSRAAEQKSAAAVEAMGHEVMRIAQNLNTRVERMEGGEGGGAIEQLGRDLSAKLERDLERHAASVDQRLDRSDETHARAIERLGDEITRISDRLSERIATSERRSSEAVDDITRRMNEQSERFERRQLMHSDLADRIRQSEERTAELLAEARESMEQRAQKPAAPAPLAAMAPHVSDTAIPPWSAAEAPASDWRTAAFGDSALWSDDDLDGLLDAAPFPAPKSEERSDLDEDSRGFPTENEAEVSAWVEARTLEAETETPFGSPAERADFGSLSRPVEDEIDALNLGQDGAGPDYVFDAEVQSELPPAAQAVDEAPKVDLGQVFDPFAPSDPSQDVSFSSLGTDQTQAEPAWLEPSAKTEASWLEAEPNASEAPSPSFEDALSDHEGPATEPKGTLSTRDALEAARAAMTQSPEPSERSGFGIKRRGGKSKLQEKLDKKASDQGSVLRKIFGTSALMALVVGGGYGFLELSDTSKLATALPRSGAAAEPPATEALAAVVLSATPTEATPSTDIAATEGASLFERATDLLDRGDDRGVEALKRAADLGHAGAQLRLAGLYEEGASGIEADLSQSRNWARRAAEGGDAKAMHYYAMQLYDGVGGAQNRAAALGWMKRAAEAGRVDSQYNVAKIYETGDTGVAKNPVEAFTWYMIAARRGDQQALAAVQRLTPVTDAESRRKARQAADAFTVDPVS